MPAGPCPLDEASPNVTHDPNCIFCKIVAGVIPARKVHEDDELIAFHDIHPWAPVHILIIPKLHIASMVDVGPEHTDLMGRMMAVTPRTAESASICRRNAFKSRRSSASNGVKAAGTCLKDQSQNNSGCTGWGCPGNCGPAMTRGARTNA